VAKKQAPEVTKETLTVTGPDGLAYKWLNDRADILRLGAGGA
jgi:hypothetical protein